MSLGKPNKPEIEPGSPVRVNAKLHSGT